MLDLLEVCHARHRTVNDVLFREDIRVFVEQCTAATVTAFPSLFFNFFVVVVKGVFVGGKFPTRYDF